MFTSAIFAYAFRQFLCLALAAGRSESYEMRGIRDGFFKFVDTANFNRTKAILQVLAMMYYFIINNAISALSIMCF